MRRVYHWKMRTTDQGPYCLFLLYYCINFAIKRVYCCWLSAILLSPLANHT